MVQNCSVWFVLFHNGEGVGDDFFVDGCRLTVVCYRLSVVCCWLLVDCNCFFFFFFFFFFFWLDYSWVYILLEFVNLRFQKKQKVKTWIPRRSNWFSRAKWKKLFMHFVFYRNSRIFDFGFAQTAFHLLCQFASLGLRPLRLFDARLRTLRSVAFCGA